MTSVEATAELRFDPPDPGFWHQDPVHHPRPITRYWAEMHPAPFVRGFSEFTERYGMLLETMRPAYIHGFAYSQSVPVSDEEAPRRCARAEEVWAQKPWREQLREWDERFKPDSRRMHEELQAVDPDGLSNDELAEYIGRCADHHAEMIYQHMRFTGAAILPIGDFLAHVVEWTKLPPSELLGLMRGSAPVSAGASDELERLIAAVEQDVRAQQLLASDGDPAEALEQLRSLEGETGAAVRAYLDLVGYRLLDGFDISGRYALELPDALLRSIAVATSTGGEVDSDVEEMIADARSRVPEEHRAQFDELLGEARLMYRLRDERGVYSDIWASGLVRRAVLAAGRRLVESGRIHDQEHLVDAGIGEMSALLAGTGGPSADELAERYRWRTSRTWRDAPETLGGPPPPPPDPSRLPPAAARVARAMGIAMGALFGSSEAEHDEDLLRGLAASAGVYEGPARLVGGPDEFDRIVQGDVLVTQSTTEAFNILLPLLGAIVTDAGGLLSHSAIVAREYGIPGVVGTREGTQRIAEGARVRVDGTAGEVTVLE